MIELFECERLSARISKAQCEKNRTRVTNQALDIFSVTACVGCSGLGAAVIFNPEGDKMATLCSVLGCEKLAQSNRNGMCKAHFSGRTPRVFKDKPAVRSRAAGSKGSCEVEECSAGVL